METLLTNKKFIRASIVFIVLLSLLTFVKFINEVKSSDYVGRGSNPINTISVSGKGEVTAVSDIAILDINLSKDSATTKDAQKLLNDDIAKTLAYLKSQNIDDKDIKSQYGGISPKYSYNQAPCMMYPCPTKDPKIIGYTSTQSIEVKVREVDNASMIRTGLASLGITDISGPNFSIDNEDSFKDQARALAITDAKTKAETLAKELGVKLGDVTSFSENTGGNYPIMYAAKAMMVGSDASAPAPVLPKGENKISTEVTITYEIK